MGHDFSKQDFIISGFDEIVQDANIPKAMAPVKTISAVVKSRNTDPDIATPQPGLIFKPLDYLTADSLTLVTLK